MGFWHTARYIMAHDIHSPLLTLGESLQSAPHLSHCLSSPAHHYWQSVFAVASTNHGHGRRGAKTDDGREEKSDGQRRGSNEATRRPGRGFQGEAPPMQFKHLAFNLVYVAEVAQLSLKGTVCVCWHRWGVVALHKQYQMQNATCSYLQWPRTISQYNLSTNSSATMFRKVTCQCMELFQIQGGYGSQTTNAF